MSPIVVPGGTPTVGSVAASGPPTIPHVSFPWRMVRQPDGTLAAASDEQDSLDEVMSAVQQIAACPVGAWVDQPSFGVPSQLFAQAPLDAEGVTRAIERWEPRASAAAREYPDQFDASIRTIAVSVSSIQQDQ